LLFARVRSVDQVERLAEMSGDALRVLTGFSLPKMTAANAPEMLAAIRDLSATIGRPLYAMPILEAPELAWVETRRDALRDLAEVFAGFREHVLCVRVGGTDLSGLFGLRRDRDTTIWDVAVVRDALADVVNQFARNLDYVVTGVVWEHIPGPRLFKPQLRESPFRQQHAVGLRHQMIGDDVDALMREISLDKNNGMYGKTVIHPTHVSIVNSMLTVHGDEYDDALAVSAAGPRGGVLTSPHGRMNEMGPHALWAEQVLARAAVFGVVADDAALVELLRIGQRVVADEYERPSVLSMVVS
jgi:citrate lyase beta subunit